MTDEIEKSALQKALGISNSAAIAKRAALDAENTAGMLDYVTALMDKSFYPFAKSLDETIPRRQPPAFPTAGSERERPATSMESITIMPPAPAAQANKLRTNTLDPAIDQAIQQAGCTVLANVYLELKALAMDECKPFTGIVDGDSLCYTDDENKPAKLSKDALRKRLKRR